MKPYTNPVEFKQSERYQQFVEMGLTGVHLDHACQAMIKLINWYLDNTGVGKGRKRAFLGTARLREWTMRSRWENATGLSVEFRNKLSAGENPYV